MKHIIFMCTFLALSLSPVVAQTPASTQNKKTMENSRTQRAAKKYKELFAQDITASKTDPELLTILQSVIFGEVFYIGNLDDKTRELITITALATNQTLPQLTPHTNAALNVGVKPIEIREVIYQCAPFIGFPKVLNALEVINKVFEQRGIKVPLETQRTITEADRLEKGLEKQGPLYGDGIKRSMQDLPGNLGTAIPTLLTESCFGDFYTRKGLDIKTRELMIFCALATLGGTERQMSSHVSGNMKVGNDKETLISAMVQLYPYVGFPRAANAMYTIKEVKAD
ncbi:carboxymuconolactone decarboxylase family protein [Dyadobacter psychrophilus]|uniref:4-carboxymuconolactone decarboxylase n=1 Tax=Dyadobacter psychrophilus TaxID=651661 RepID=A0A1T5BIM9_9BACT|nr:carboxymuconolactone decarboxylase family protein [Dyadobacter psychrophilus]SKB46860.1 4-carboxymuconolactone decarboxylase [Dyadobacter psychrophilus]